MTKIENNSLDRTIELLNYWQAQLAGSPPLLDLSTDKPRSSSVDFTTAIHHIYLPTELVTSLQQLGDRQQVHLSTMLLAGLKILMYRYTDREDLAIGAPSLNQHSDAVAEARCTCANLLVFRTDLSGNPRFLEVLQRVQKVVTEAYQHQGLPFDRSIETLNIEHSDSYHPLFQVMFSWAQNDRLVSAAEGQITEIKSSEAQCSGTKAVANLAHG
jgi:non-ribosomal peptide synthetase component F